MAQARVEVVAHACTELIEIDEELRSSGMVFDGGKRSGNIVMARNQSALTAVARREGQGKPARYLTDGSPAHLFDRRHPPRIQVGTAIATLVRKADHKPLARRACSTKRNRNRAASATR